MDVIKLGSLYQKENKNKKPLKKTCVYCDTKVSFFLGDDEVCEITSHGEKKIQWRCPICNKINSNSIENEIIKNIIETLTSLSFVDVFFFLLLVFLILSFLFIVIVVPIYSLLHPLKYNYSITYNKENQIYVDDYEYNKELKLLTVKIDDKETIYYNVEYLEVSPI